MNRADPMAARLHRIPTSAGSRTAGSIMSSYGEFWASCDAGGLLDQWLERVGRVRPAVDVLQLHALQIEVEGETVETGGSAIRAPSRSCSWPRSVHDARRQDRATRDHPSGAA
jgi:hypothetical protein